MRVIELVGATGQKTGMAVVPLDGRSSDVMGFTQSSLELAKMFRYSAWFLVNRDRVRGWRSDLSAPLLDLDGRAIFSSYASNPADLNDAGESYLVGLVEDWLEDLRRHWKHSEGAVPGETALAQSGLKEDLGLSTPSVGAQ